MPEQNSFKDFAKKNIKGNTGVFDTVFMAGDIKNLLTGEEMLKSIYNIMKEITLGSVIFKASLAGAFKAVSSTVKSLVKDTGSLDAAIRRLAQIQGLEKSFAGFLGGIDQAKKKVAELAAYASSRKISLGDVGEAARTLEVLTRGLYTSTKALDTINNAAKATGNSMASVADKVGEFQNTLRGGDSISGLSEQMRQMGIISQQTADKLVLLQSAGASNGEVFRTLTESMEKFATSAEKVSGTVSEVNEAFETAKQTLQEKFAAPFTEDEIKNTQNYTKALEEMAPMVERLGKYFSVLFNGLSTTKSTFVAWIAQSAALKTAVEGSVYVLTGLITAVSAVSALGLGSWLIKAASSAGSLHGKVNDVAIVLTKFSKGFISLGTGATIATRAVQGFQLALSAAGIGVFIQVAMTAYGVWKNYADGVAAAKEKVRAAAEAQVEANNALLDQIENVKTAIEKHEVLTKALEAQTKAELDLIEARNKDKGDTASREDIRDKKAAKKSADKTVDKANAIKPITSKEQDELTRSNIERDKSLNEQAFQTKLQNASPEERASLLAGRSIEASSKSDRAAAGAKTSVGVKNAQLEAENRVKAAEEELKQAEADQAANEVNGLNNKDKFSPEVAEQMRESATNRVLNAIDNLVTQKHQAGQVGLGADKDSSAYAYAMARKETDSTKQKNWMEYGQKREADEKASGELAVNAAATGDAAKAAGQEAKSAEDRARMEGMVYQMKEDGFTLTKAENKLKLDLLAQEKAALIDKQGGLSIAQTYDFDTRKAQLQKAAGDDNVNELLTRNSSKNELYQQDALLSGRSADLAALKDSQGYEDKYSEYRSAKFSEDESAGMAKKFMDNSIAISGQNTALAMNDATKATSLAKIGGGGNVATASNDMKSIAKRQEDLQKKMVQFLGDIAAAKAEGTLE